MKFLDELKWRGLLQDFTPGLEELLDKHKIFGYAGFDPSADSLHIGNLVPVTLLHHFQRYGHTPVVLMGGATGQIGDPSGKVRERKLLSLEEISNNLHSQQLQLERFLDFSKEKNKAVLINNNEWFGNIKFLDFMRDSGKYITISYMLGKDSVKNRLESGISFAEFSYQMIQGYDFFWLNQHKNVLVQMGGSDQWGNMLTGTELIRRKSGKEAHAFTAPLITKADGSKFGKSEGGNIWLDPKRTSPYKFYQYWLNISDEEALRYIRVFSFKSIEEITGLMETHKKNEHLRTLQHALSEELTRRIHSERELENVISASNILFGSSTREELIGLSNEQLLEVFSDVPQHRLDANELGNMNIVDLLSDKTGILASKSEARRMLQANSISLNKEKVTEDKVVTKEDLISNKYLLIQRGRKNYHLIQIND